MSKLDCLKNNQRSDASKGHRAIGELLNSYFAHMRVYQEYPVNRIYLHYESGREKFDWVILDLKVVIEFHGQQHYQCVRFGGITQEEAEIRFRDQRIRDEAKRRAAIAAGFIYVIFRYDEEVSLTSLLQKIDQAKQSQETTTELISIHPNNTSSTIRIDTDRKRKESEQHKSHLAKQKEYRKKRYQLWKERKSGNSK